MYVNILDKFEDIGISYLQIDEPILVTDLNKEDIRLFKKVYIKILEKKYKFKVLLQTYSGDIRDIYNDLMDINFDEIGLDFNDGKKNIELIKEYGFPKEKTLFSGIVNGGNIWKNDYKKILEIIEELKNHVDINISTSCSLLHVPYTLENEKQLSEEYKESLAFSHEKLKELNELKKLINNKDYKDSNLYINNQEVIKRKKLNKLCFNKILREKIENLKEEDFSRNEHLEERRQAP